MKTNSKKTTILPAVSAKSGSAALSAQDRNVLLSIIAGELGINNGNTLPYASLIKGRA